MAMQISGVTIQGGMNILPRAGAPSPAPGPSPALGPSDPNFSNVVFMFDGDGTDGDDNNTFTDSSSNGFTVTETGSVVQGSFSPYGDNWSYYLNAASGDILSVPDSTVFNLGAADFTIESWVNIQDFGTENAIGVVSQWENGNRAWVFYVAPSVINFSYSISGNDYNNNLASVTSNKNEWIHVAVTRSGNTLRIFKNGAVVLTTSITATIADSSQSVQLNTATNYGAGELNISNLRIVNGTAVYTSAFTPPTEPLTAITNTVLLTCQSNRFTDNSSNGFTFSVTGLPKVTPFSPFKDDDARDITTDGGSGYFDTSGDTLTVPYSSTLAMGTGDCTIEAWVYFDSYPQAFSNILDTRASGSYGSDAISFSVENDGTFSFYAGSYSLGTHVLETASGTVTLNSWYHLVVTRVSGTTKLYVNGVEEASSTNAWNQTSGSSTNLYIAGAAGVTRQVNGYISNLRLVKGTAVYTTTFTPPTSPLTAVTNTELLLNFQDAGIYDRTGLNNIDTAGNAQIDTAIKKYGTGSVKFDGTDDCLEIPYSTAFELGTQSFTIEFWINTSQTAIATILDRRLGSTSSAGYLLAHNLPSQGNLTFYAAGVSWPLLTSNSNLPLNQWVHVAIVRNGSSFAMYFDGNSVATATSSASFNDAAAPFFIGRNVNPTSQRLDGYIDDFRFTKGVARYTSNFTPPTAALPKF